MATAALIPVSEYLQTTYRPDRDYIDGELKERNVGEQPHGDVQVILGAIFRNNRRVWGVRPLSAARLQVTPTRFRIPDVTILRNTDPKDPIISFAPLLCVEILSKDDRLHEMQDRVDDYASMGVQPDDGVLQIEQSAIQISLKELFEELDAF